MKMLLTTLASFAFLAIAGAQDDAETKKDKAILAGAWKMEVFETAEGKNDDLVGAMLVFEGDKMDFKHKDETKKASYTINAIGKPKEITIKTENAEMNGIYKVDKETLTICICLEPNQARPNEFAAKNPYVLATLKRS